jgi:hypothetical protein
MENIRSGTDRRTGKDRRRLYHISYLRKKGKDRRRGQERRIMAEQRVGWVRVDKWRSARLENLMIAKYLKL